MTTDRLGRKSVSSAAPIVTGFEAGACVAMDMRTAAVQSPELPASADPMMAVEEKRIELLQECDVKIRDTTARAADLRQQAHEKEGEWRRIDATGARDAATLSRIDVLRRAEDGLSQESRRLIDIDLPRLEQERMGIADGRHAMLVAMRISAEGRIRSAKPDLGKLPAFVILDENFGWTEHEQHTSFRSGQIVRDQEQIRKLIERSAPLTVGPTA